MKLGSDSLSSSQAKSYSGKVFKTIWSHQQFHSWILTFFDQNGLHAICLLLFLLMTPTVLVRNI